jgi:branched-subunit amino acid transport protein
MDATLKLWIVIVTVGLLNYLSRLSFIAFFARRSMPPLLARALRYVPAAMLTALVLPMIVVSADAGVPIWQNARILAALVAGAVAFRIGGSLPTIAAGMAALWLLQAVLH